MPLKIFKTKSNSNKASSSAAGTDNSTGPISSLMVDGGGQQQHLAAHHHHHHRGRHHQPQQQQHRIYYERLLSQGGSPLLRERPLNPAVPLDRDEVHTHHSDKGLLVGNFYHTYAVSRICLKERHNYYKNNTQKQEEEEEEEAAASAAAAASAQRKALADISTNQQKGYYSIKCISKKTIKKLQANDKQLLVQAKTNLLVEANYLSKFHHHNIIELHGMMMMMMMDSSSASTDSAEPFLITERIEETLEDRIHKTWHMEQIKDPDLHAVDPHNCRSTFGMKMRYAKEIANALQYLHTQHRIVVLGLSPSSIGFLSSSGRLQLCNLGTCRELIAYDNKSKVTTSSNTRTSGGARARSQSLSESEKEARGQTNVEDSTPGDHDDDDDDDVSRFDDDDIGDGERFNTISGDIIVSEEETDNLMIPMVETGMIPRYVAPEVVLKGSTSVTLQADVYSWAMIVVEMITLQKAFSHYRKGEFLRRVCMEGKRPNLSFYSKLPQSMEAVLRRCWRQSVDKRWNSNQVVEAMEKIIEKHIDNNNNNNTSNNSKQECDDDIAPPLPSRLSRSISVPEASTNRVSGSRDVAIDTVIMDGSLMQQSVMTEQSDSSRPRRRRESKSSSMSWGGSATGGGSGLPVHLLHHDTTTSVGGGAPINDDSLMRQSITSEPSSTTTSSRRRGSKSRSLDMAVPAPLLHRATSAPTGEDGMQASAMEQSSSSSRRRRRRSSKSQSVDTTTIPAPLLQHGPHAPLEDEDSLLQQSAMGQSSNNRQNDSDQHRRKSCRPPPPKGVMAANKKAMSMRNLTSTTTSKTRKSKKTSTTPRRTRSSGNNNEDSTPSRVKSKSPRRIKSGGSEPNTKRVSLGGGIASGQTAELQLQAAQDTCPDGSHLNNSLEANISYQSPMDRATTEGNDSAVVNNGKGKGPGRSNSPKSPKSPPSKRSSNMKAVGVETKASSHEHLKDISLVPLSSNQTAKPTKRSSKGERKRESRGKSSNDKGESGPDLRSKRLSKSSNTLHPTDHTTEEGSKEMSVMPTAQDADRRMADELIEQTSKSASKGMRKMTSADLKRKKEGAPKYPQSLEGNREDGLALVAQGSVNNNAEPTDSNFNYKAHTTHIEKKPPMRSIRRTMSTPDIERTSSSLGVHSKNPVASSSSKMREKPAAGATKRPSLMKAASFLGFGRKHEKSNVGTTTSIEIGSSRRGKGSMMSMQKHASERMLNRR